MPINADKPQLWKQDIAASVDLFNNWFMKSAPKAYRDTRARTVRDVEATLRATRGLRELTVDVLKKKPGILPTLRMACCPPLARDRLVGLAYANKNLVKKMEEGALPPRMSPADVNKNLEQIAEIIAKMLDRDIVPWLQKGSTPTAQQRQRASTIVADRLCGSLSDPIIRNAQEKRQLGYIQRYLTKKGYKKKPHPPTKAINEMDRGTFSFRTNVVVGAPPHPVNMPIDAVIQPRSPRRHRMPILIEAKSAGDFTNVNKRRKEEATKIHQLRAAYGEKTQFILFLCGYFDTGYLGYEAAEGIDWIWEHRIEDMEKLGI